MKEYTEIKQVLNATQEVGDNFCLSQGAGGNISYKIGDSLFIKATGLKLSSAKFKNIFVEVNLVRLIKNIENSIIDPLEDTWTKSKFHRPSIETTMHAIMPHKYIFHLHCLNTISVVVQRDFEQKLALFFNDLNYAVVKYVMPGISLTREIKKIFNKFVPDILFLANHGLVVGANSINDALKKIYYISNTLDIPYSKDVSLNINSLDVIANNSFYRPTKYQDAHQLAASIESIKIASSGSLFPDQVVFLGPKIYVINNKDEFLKISKRLNSNNRLPIIIVPKSGVLVPKNINNEAEELVLALSIIISRISNPEKIRYLRKSEEDELIFSIEEKYRLNITN